MSLVSTLSVMAWIFQRKFSGVHGYKV